MGHASPADRQRRLNLAAIALTGVGIVAVGAGAIWLSGEDPGQPSSDAATEVLAVTPFRALDDDPQMAHFGVGLADAIISDLARVRGLTVRSLSAAIGAAEGGADPIETARRLRAMVVMSGEYHHENGRFQVTVRLLDVRTGAALWEHALDSAVADLMEVERSVAEQTIAALLPGLSDAERVVTADAERRDATAHYLYLLARGKNATWQAALIPEAIELLEQATRLDPDFAPAHAEVSFASANMILASMSNDRHWIERALAAGRRAVHLDDRSTTAHYALGHAMLVAGDPVGATRETLRALRLDPRNADALRALAGLVAGAGEPAPVRALRDAARREGARIELGWLDVWLAMIEGDYEAKISELEREVERRREDGGSPELPIMQLAYLAYESGDTAGQLRCAAMLEKISANRPYADLMRLLALGRSGDEAGMRRLIEKNRGFYTNYWDQSDLIGRGFASMGLTEDALTWLTRSAELGNYDAATWERSPKLDSLRGDPRFESALALVRERMRAIVQLAEFAGYM